MHAVFFLSHPSAAREYLVVADRIADQGGRCSFLCLSPPCARALPADGCTRHAIIDRNGRPVRWSEIDRAGGESGGGPARRSLAAAMQWLKTKSVTRAPLAIVALAVAFRRAARRFRRILEGLDGGVAIVDGDRSLADLPFLAAARSLDVPVVMLPIAEASPRSLADYRRGHAALDLNGTKPSTLKALVGRLFPAHAYTSMAGSMLFYDPPTMLALALVGHLPRQPWVLGGGGIVDAVCVMADGDKQHFADFGLPLASVHVTGQASLDCLFVRNSRRDRLRSDLAASYGVDPSRPLVVCGVPQSWPETSSWGPDDYRDLFAILSACPANVLLSLHPKTTVADYPMLAEYPLLRSARESLAEILPAASVYLATYSSTLRWSLALCQPAAIVDFPTYPLGRPDNPFPHYPVCQTPQALAAWLGETLADGTVDAIRTRLKPLAALAGPFDGEATTRIVKVVEDVMTARAWS